MTDICVVTPTGWALLERTDEGGWVAYGADIHNLDACAIEGAGHFIDWESAPTEAELAEVVARLAT